MDKKQALIAVTVALLVALSGCAQIIPPNKEQITLKTTKNIYELGETIQFVIQNNSGRAINFYNTSSNCPTNAQNVKLYKKKDGQFELILPFAGPYCSDVYQKLENGETATINWKTVWGNIRLEKGIYKISTQYVFHREPNNSPNYAETQAIFFIPLESNEFEIVEGDTPQACTADAKLCPDGSAVGRDGNNNCEFFECPASGQGVVLSTDKTHYFTTDGTDYQNSDIIKVELENNLEEQITYTLKNSCSFSYLDMYKKVGEGFEKASFIDLECYRPDETITLEAGEKTTVLLFTPRTPYVNGEEAAFEGTYKISIEYTVGENKNILTAQSNEFQLHNEPLQLLSYSPVQCGGNPWEVWHEGLGRVYIRAPTEQEILTEYYSVVEGVEILDFKAIPALPDTVVCEACSCPRGDTIEVLVKENDAQEMTALGWMEKAALSVSEIKISGGFFDSFYTNILNENGQIELSASTAGDGSISFQKTCIAQSNEFEELLGLVNAQEFLDFEESDLITVPVEEYMGGESLSIVFFNDTQKEFVLKSPVQQAVDGEENKPVFDVLNKAKGIGLVL